MNATQYKECFSREFQGMNDAIDNVFTPIFGEFTEKTNPTEIDYADVNQFGNGGANIDHIYDYGTYYTDSTNVSVFEVVLSDNCQISRARKNIQNTVRKITDRYAGAFIIFHYASGSNNPEAQTWRLSWLKRLHKDSSSAKRYTYLCGPSYSCRTIAQRFDELQKTSNKTLDTITAAFDVEALSKEFFDEYKIFYEDIVQYICGKRIVPKRGQKGWENEQIESNDIIAKRGVYTCFQQEFPGIDTHGNINAEKAVRDYVKKLMGRLVFIQFLQKKGWLGLPSTQDSWTGGDIHFLVNIFKNHQDQKDDFVNQVLVKILFDSFNKADSCHDGIKYPYLNGGLFEQDQADKLPIKLPGELFVSDYPETTRKFNGVPNANEEYDYKKSEGLFQFFERYNFTIDENDPNDAIVGVDPEMLGKIFENLLEDNKDKGAFYTPKEIVQYMCKESLIAYLCSQINGIDDGIRKLVEEGECGDVVSEHKTEVISALKAVKICDPAIGSGAFPMGLLNLLVHLRETMGETDRCQLKKDIILNNIYGVDIEKGAVDIARLRFWLSIMVDDDKPSPLPNFDFKFMQGNSLLETYEGVDLSKIAGSKQKKTSNAQTNLVFDEKDVLNNIQVLLKQYFKLQGTEKEKCKQSIEKGVKEYIRFMTEGIDKEKQDKLLDINMSANDQFFLWHTWFADVFENGGFDIVIGNPPYVSTKGRTDEEKEILNSAFGFVDDLYHHFIIHGFNILKEEGIQSMITSDTYFTTLTKTALRKKFLSYSILQIVHWGHDIFEDALVSTASFFCQKCKKGSANITFYDVKGKKTILDGTKYQINQKEYSKSINGCFYVPTPLCMGLNSILADKHNSLMKEWWAKIETSKKISKNESELNKYRASLKPGDVTLIGLVTDGGQGMATGDNGKFVGVKAGTKQADTIIDNRSQKLAEVNRKYHLNNILPSEETDIWALFDNLKLQYGNKIFGQGYVYRIVPDQLLADITSLTDLDKSQGISGKQSFVPYDKGDKDGNKWYNDNPFVIDWSKANVHFFKTNSGKKGNGMPVVRNAQFYFKEGFCWNNNLNERYFNIKCKEKKAGVHDVASMSLFELTTKVPAYYLVILINSSLCGYFYRMFLNNTVNVQVNDLRMLPVIVPSEEQLTESKKLFDDAVKVQKAFFNQQISSDERDRDLMVIQSNVDAFVFGIYGLQQSDYPPLGKTLY